MNQLKRFFMCRYILWQECFSTSSQMLHPMFGLPVNDQYCRNLRSFFVHTPIVCEFFKSFIRISFNRLKTNSVVHPHHTRCKYNLHSHASFCIICIIWFIFFRLSSLKQSYHCHRAVFHHVLPLPPSIIFKSLNFISLHICYLIIYLAYSCKIRSYNRQFWVMY